MQRKFGESRRIYINLLSCPFSLDPKAFSVGSHHLSVEVESRGSMPVPRPREAACIPVFGSRVDESFSGFGLNPHKPETRAPVSVSGDWVVELRWGLGVPRRTGVVWLVAVYLGLGFEVYGLGFRVKSLGVRAVYMGLGLRIQGVGCRISELKIRV